MAAFYLLRHDGSSEADRLSREIRNSLRRQGFGTPVLHRGPDCEIGAVASIGKSTDCQLLSIDRKAVAVVGTIFYGQLSGSDAMRQLTLDVASDTIDWPSLWGCFAMVIATPDRTILATDRVGTCHLYHDSNYRAFSTSFLAIAEAIPRRTINQTAVYDYVVQGAPHGGTVLNEVQLFDSGTVVEMSHDRRISYRPFPSIAADETMSLDVAARRCIEVLRSRFQVLANGFGNNISLGLSGGFDSRLILSLLLSQGVQPRLHVYGGGDSADVGIAKEVANHRKLEIEHIDKSAFPIVAPVAFSSTVARNYDQSDAYPTDGIFNSGADLITRQHTCANGELMLNGGGGEIFRDFFHLPLGAVAASEIVRRFYCQFDPAICTGRFALRDYVADLATRINESLCVRDGKLSRPLAEAAYAFFRCRFWMGRNNSLNNRFGSALTPFVDPLIVQSALAVPAQLRCNGRLQARMISLALSDIASIRSIYGPGFDLMPSWRFRLHEYVLRHRPIVLQSAWYRLKQRRVPTTPWPIDQQHVRALLGQRCDYMNEFFNVSAVRDPGQLNRMYTLEYLFRRVEASSP